MPSYSFYGCLQTSNKLFAGSIPEIMQYATRPLILQFWVWYLSPTLSQYLLFSACITLSPFVWRSLFPLSHPVLVMFISLTFPFHSREPNVLVLKAPMKSETKDCSSPPKGSAIHIIWKTLKTGTINYNFAFFLNWRINSTENRSTLDHHFFLPLNETLCQLWSRRPICLIPWSSSVARRLELSPLSWHPESFLKTYKTLTQKDSFPMEGSIIHTTWILASFPLFRPFTIFS